MDQNPEKSPLQIFDELRAMARGFDRKLTEVAETISRAVAPVLNVLDDAARKLADIREQFRPIIEKANSNQLEAERLRQVALALEAAGWFPWMGAPFSELSKSAEPSREYELWLEKNWQTIRRGLHDFVVSSDLGESSGRSLVLALQAHEEGYYEQVPRILYPEVEKCAGLFFYAEPAPRGETQLPRMRESLKLFWEFSGGLLSYLEPSLGPAASPMTALGKYVYGRHRDVAGDPLAQYFPNRDRVLHGIRSDDFNSEKASINSLLIYSVMIGGIATAKALGITSDKLGAHGI